MHHPISITPQRLRQAGMTLVELMVSITIALIVLSGVVQVLVVSKSNFVSIREMAGLQENARFAIKYLTDEIRQAGSSGCMYPAPVYTTNVIKGGYGSWYLDQPGLQGYEYDAGVATYPIEFRADVKANTDAIVVRRAEQIGLRLTGEVLNSALITTNIAHPYKIGQPMVVVTPDCEQMGVFQINATTATTNLSHGTGTAVPGNAVAGLWGSVVKTYYNAAGTLGAGVAPLGNGYPVDSSVLALHSEAYYIGNSESDATVPALFRERMQVNTTTNTAYTAEEELVQGVENMQVLYGMDINSTPGDGLADQYVKANAITGVSPMLWRNVVSVRITMRLRSIAPVYINNETYAAFDDGAGNAIAGTNGSDRYMRQTISTTIMVRNFHQ